MTNHSRQAELRATLERAGLHDRRVLDAVEATRRDLFVPAELEDRAYDDSALPIGLGQTISQPYMVALMTQELALDGGELVLEIGTGSGYQAAILSKLCREVVTVERLPELAEKAQRALSKIGCANIEFCVGDGTLGWPARAPFDGIIVTAAAPKIPAPLLNQLKPGGRLVIPIGEDAIQTLVVVTRQEPQPTIRNVCGCRFVKLIGEAGWPPE
ncbi:MAG: protein-L-isoaspartate(D-aspartate) O-methyltransferase [Planctomycetaceae bacterium]|jgi:protein-L-isoaspartate(D-aspartate) O-methyltransferase|nr:protein-L-isoaspartate(D-aspartate) O-methyltransferase [Planctomycetaceae bacterium]MBT6155127.1 protein-L-isoaspartate(D-aspartate) O-methyltransferase [Planctomycetaceae bacterium]MBT6483357.1 protein-L-isoaspartate(D-aspartate) O-methyltransferase [Planctomycetaceae bacterium]MBT6493847.1 protein-L-isoaspartate(D-aspartate) O-methyltransferase [Planctomycetaceae bacterium]